MASKEEIGSSSSPGTLEQPKGTKRQLPKIPVGRTVKTELSLQDNIWKDMIRHEKLLIKLWNWKWDFLLYPPHHRPNIRSRSIDQKLLEEGRKLGLIPYQILKKREIYFKPSVPTLPPKSSGMIGWRSQNPENSFDLFITPNEKPVPKISFVKEERGYYRRFKILRSLQDEQESLTKEKDTIIRSKRITHRVKPLLC